MRSVSLVLVAVLALLVQLLLCAGVVQSVNYKAPNATQIAALQKYQNIIVLVESAASFDFLFGDYSRAGAAPVPVQVNRTGFPYPCLPQDNTGLLVPGAQNPACASMTGSVANGVPVQLNTILPVNATFSNDDFHGFFNSKYNAANASNYVYWGGGGSGSDPISGSLSHWQGGLAVGRYNLTGSYLYQLASNYTLFTQYFASSFGGPFLNHQTLVGTAKVLYNNSATVCHNALGSNGAPSDVVFPSFSAVDGKLSSQRDSSTVGTTSNVPAASQDCYVNTQLHSINFGKVPHLAPINASHIGDTLSAKGASWVWYAEDFSYEISHETGGGTFYSYNDQPFVYYNEFQNLSDPNFLAHNKDANTDFFTALNSNSLPNISWVKPDQSHDFGISDNSTQNGINRLQQYVSAIQATAGFQSGKTLLLVTWADGDNQFDHVAPYVGDNWGPGPRVPLIAVGKSFAGGAINNSPFEHLSLVSMLETKVGVARTSSASLIGSLGIATRSQTIADFTTAFA